MLKWPSFWRQLGSRPRQGDEHPAYTPCFTGFVYSRVARCVDVVSEDDVDEDLFATVVVLAWRRYEFYVSAVNELGESELSAAVTSARCLTAATAPSRNPRDVCSRLDAPKQLVITWQVTLHSD